jgi:hypothetical protein
MGQQGELWLPRRRAQGLLAETVGDEVVVFDERAGEVHCLTGAAATVWSLCDGSRGPDAIAAAAALDEGDARRALRVLRELDLLEPAYGQTARVTRRTLARRALQAGAGALVLSAAVPAAADAASLRGLCASAPHCGATLLNPGPVADPRDCSSGWCYAGVVAGVLGPAYCVPAGCAGIGLACSLSGASCCLGTCTLLVCVGNACNH